jgi:hypothetical protein
LSEAGKEKLYIGANNDFIGGEQFIHQLVGDANGCALLGSMIGGIGKCSGNPILADERQGR